MSIRFTDSGPQFSAEVDVPARIMREIGEGLLTRIRSRTTKGVSVDGSTFARLSSGYAAQKRKALGHSRADLQVSGGMLNGMTLRPRPNHLTVSFAGGGMGGARGGTFIQRSRATSPGDKAFFHNVTGAGRSGTIREFFGVSSEDEDWIISALNRYFDDTL